MSKTIEITVPSIGGAERVLVVELLVARGDQVANDQSLVVLESDPLSADPSALRTMPVAATLLGGRVTHADPALDYFAMWENRNQRSSSS